MTDILTATSRQFRKVLARPGLGLEPTDKRRHPEGGLKGICLHVTAEQAKKAYAIWESMGTVESGYRTVQEAATQAEVASTTFVRNMTTEELSHLVFKNRKGGGKITYAPGAILDAVIERVKPQSLPPYLVPRVILRARTNLSTGGLLGWIERNQFEPAAKLNLGGKGGEAVCYDWSLLRALEADRPPSADVPKILWDRLPKGDEDDPAKNLYAQMVQSLYIPTERLQAKWHNVTEAAHLLRVTPYAFSIMLNVAKIDKEKEVRHVDGKPQVSIEALGKLVPILSRSIVSRDGWVSHAKVIAHAREHESTLLHTLPSLVGANEWMVGAGAKYRQELIDMWYAPSAVRKIEVFLSRIKARANAPKDEDD